jgi:hypothetical protein
VFNLIVSYSDPFRSDIDIDTIFIIIGEASRPNSLTTLEIVRTMSDPSLYTYPSPLEGYENLPPLST